MLSMLNTNAVSESYNGRTRWSMLDNESGVRDILEAEFNLQYAINTLGY
jgi:hypothetical protein